MLSMIWQDMRITSRLWQKTGLFGLKKRKGHLFGMNTPSLTASKITAATASLFHQMGDATLSEFTLKTGRRVDLIALSRDQHISVIEVKSSLADFTSDKKWPDYLDWADRFYFAVADDFPRDRLPDETVCGLIITDGFDAHILRESPVRKLAVQRRSHLIRRLAFAAMMRLSSD